MATVPVPKSPSVSPQATAQPLQHLDAPALAFGGNVAGAVISDLGKAVGDRATAFHTYALQQQAINNKVEADQRSIGYASAADKISLDFRTNNTGMAAVNNLDQAYKELEETRAKAAEGLSPDAQVAFNVSSRGQLAQTQSSLRDFAVTQRKTAIVKTSEANLDLASAQAAASDDPAVIADSLAKIGNEVAFMSRPDVVGLTPEQGKALLQTRVGAIFAGKIRIAVDQGDYPKAQAIFDEHKNNMTAEQIDQVSGAMKVGQNAYIANGWADSFIEGHSTPPEVKAASGQPNVLSALKAAVPGATVTSTVRSVAHNAEVGGVPNSQHITGTAADFVPAKGQTMAQLADQLRAVGVGKVIPESDHVHVQWGGGKAGSPLPVNARTDPEQFIADSYAAIEAQSAHDFPNNPTLRAQASAAARNRVNITAQQLRAGQSATYTRLASAVLDNSVQDEASLSTAYPGAATDLANLPPNYQLALKNTMKGNANSITPERQDAIVMLRGMRDQHPEEYVKANLAQYDLPASTRLAMMKDQQDVQAKMAKQGGKVVQNDTAVKQALNTVGAKAALSSLGLTGDERSTAYYNFAGALAIEIDNYAQVHGKPPVAGSKDMNAIVSQVTANVGAKKGWFGTGLFADPGHPAFTVPDDFRTGIISEAQKRGQVLNEYQIGQLYRRSLSAK